LNRVRLLYQYSLGFIARHLGFNHLLTQFCDRCGRTRWGISWWDDTTKVWEAVAGNVNGHHHGCFCPNCFSVLAKEKGIYLIWKPTIMEDSDERLD
jgi:hypothetical protein